MCGVAPSPKKEKYLGLELNKKKKKCTLARNPVSEYEPRWAEGRKSRKQRLSLRLPYLLSRMRSQWGSCDASSGAQRRQCAPPKACSLAAAWYKPCCYLSVDTYDINSPNSSAVGVLTVLLHSSQDLLELATRTPPRATAGRSPPDSDGTLRYGRVVPHPAPKMSKNHFLKNAPESFPHQF